MLLIQVNSEVEFRLPEQLSEVINTDTQIHSTSIWKPKARSLEAQPPFPSCIINGEKEDHVKKKSCDQKLHKCPKIGLMKWFYACLSTLFRRYEHSFVVAFLLLDLRTLSNSCLDCILTLWQKKIQVCTFSSFFLPMHCPSI